MSSAGRLRLVVCKGHPRPIEKHNLVDGIIQRQARLLLLSNDAILIRRFSSGRIVFWNHGAQKLYGWSKKIALGKPAYDLLQTKLPEPLREIKAKLRRHGCWTGKLVQTTKDGRKIVVASCWSLRQSPNGGPTEILEANYHVTDRKQSSHRAQEIERLARVGTMAAMFAHEVANPLSGLSASLQFAQSDLQKQNVDVSILRATLQAAIQEVDRLVSLLSEFRSLTLPQSLDLKLTDLQEIIREILAAEKIAYRAAGITVKTDFESSFSPVNIDSAKIKQVVLNLCKNAIEAMGEGGCLTMKVYRSGHMVVLEVSDTGIGVLSGMNIFESFKSTKRDGSGLGLALVRQIVSAHNGIVNYTTEAGHGTTFKVCLPAPNPPM
ncbi:MAG TPA: ATP-binding protein [Candidatus Binatia bacterium]|nr:ATP-binding protein [Candidatus Binatia bacterium]